MPFDDHGREDRRRPDPLELLLERDNAMLLLIDVQERLGPGKPREATAPGVRNAAGRVQAMPPEALAQVLRNAAVLIKAAVRVGLPVVASEQYVKGLGSTMPEL